MHAKNLNFHKSLRIAEDLKIIKPPFSDEKRSERLLVSDMPGNFKRAFGCFIDLESGRTLSHHIHFSKALDTKCHNFRHHLMQKHKISADLARVILQKISGSLCRHAERVLYAHELHTPPPTPPNKRHDKRKVVPFVEGWTAPIPSSLPSPGGGPARSTSPDGDRSYDSKSVD